MSASMDKSLMAGVDEAIAAAETVVAWQEKLFDGLSLKRWRKAVSQARGTTNFEAWAEVIALWMRAFGSLPKSARESERAIAVWDVSECLGQTLVSLAYATELDSYLSKLEEEAAKVVEAATEEPARMDSWNHAFHRIRESLSEQTFERVGKNTWNATVPGTPLQGYSAVSCLMLAFMAEWNEDEKRSLDLDLKLERVAMRTVDNNAMLDEFEIAVSELRDAYDALDLSVKTFAMSSILNYLYFYSHEGGNYINWRAFLNDTRILMLDYTPILEG